MEVPPSEPFGSRHPAEHRMRRPGEVVVQRRHSIEERFDPGEVCGEITRPGPPASLIDFRARLDAGWPSQRKIQRDPFHHDWREPIGGRRDRGAAGRHPARIGEMTDHLMRGHLSPLSGALRIQRPQPADKFRLVSRVGERLHASTAHKPMSRSPPDSRKAARASCRPASAFASSAWNAGFSRKGSNCGQFESVCATK
jgi:hypothetical protein